MFPQSKTDLIAADELQFEAGSPSLDRSNLICYYGCAVWYSFYRYGWLYVHEDLINFEAPWMMYGKLTIRFEDIASIVADSNSIKIVNTKKEEIVLYLLVNLNETFKRLEYLWCVWIGRLALQAELEIEPLYGHQERVNYKVKSLQGESDVLSLQHHLKRSFIRSASKVRLLSEKSGLLEDLSQKMFQGDTSSNTGAASSALNNNNRLSAISPRASADEILEYQSLSSTPDATPPTTPFLTPRLSQPSLTSISSPNSSTTTTGVAHTPSNRNISSNNFLLNAAIRSAHFRKLFRLPSSETVLYELEAYLWHIKSYKRGHLYVSGNFLAYYSEEFNLKLIVPFVIVKDISEPKPMPKIGHGLTIQTDTGAFFLCFEKPVDILHKKLQGIKACCPNVHPNLSILSDASAALKLGFADGAIFKRTTEVQFKENYLPQQKSLEMKWWKYLSSHGIGSSMIQSPNLAELIREGIPDSLRGSAWKLMSGITCKALADSMNYNDVVKQVNIDGRPAHADKVYVEHIIELDLRRSMPDHPFYQCDEGIAALRRVLTAYAFRNPVVSYCQGMNFIVAALLLYLPEEDAFWALALLCEDIFPELWRPRLFGVRIVQEVMDSILETHLPEFVKACVEYPPNLAMMSWIPTFLVGRVPLQYSLQMLDNIFYYGSDALYWVLFATFDLIVQKNGPKLTTETLLYFAAPIQAGLESATHPFDEIFELAFSGTVQLDKLPSALIDHLGCEHKMKLVHELTEKARKTKLASLQKVTINKLTEAQISNLYTFFHSIIERGDAGLLSLKRFASCYSTFFSTWRPTFHLFKVLQGTMNAYKLNKALQFDSNTNETSSAAAGSSSTTTTESTTPFIPQYSFILDVFSQFDSNSDGYLSMEEWAAGLCRIFKSDGPETLQFCMNIVLGSDPQRTVSQAAHMMVLGLFVLLYSPFDHEKLDLPQTATPAKLSEWLSVISARAQEASNSDSNPEDIVALAFSGAFDIFSFFNLDKTVPHKHLEKILS